ncbi:Hypothetical predicted protein [Mytilus galloprovincialis]|uniref:Tyr recombinase domain-containing protein n=1 Tax=Mytilus galloprovincialis TaxID=29158 RepID=A0A8B6FM82_MYTGA|nr:Hypothetical predicted protein [Mytilus galloprovincialis]
MELRLPGEKLSLLKHELAEFSKRKRASKKQLQSIAGKLNWASAVVHGGRVFLRRIIDAITPLKHDWHKAILHGEIWHDIEWWKKFLETFNGKSLILGKIPLSSVYTDACKEGGGGFFGCDWFYTNWENDFPVVKNLHINELEALAVVLAAQRWGKDWENKRVVIFSDNMTTVACLNKCTSRSKILMSYLRDLFWLSATYNFHITAVHVPGKVPLLPFSSLSCQALKLSFDICPSSHNLVSAFMFSSKSKLMPLTYNGFLARLKQSLKSLGYDSSKYSGHSFRRGGATFALECGVPSEIIQTQGDWKSDAYKNYLDPSFTHRQTVMNVFAKALPKMV